MYMLRAGATVGVLRLKASGCTLVCALGDGV